MKQLPPSWTKLKDKQLSFASVFDKPNREDIFIEDFYNTLKNAKFLRYRANWAKIKKVESLNLYTELSSVLEFGATILSKLAPKSTMYKDKTIDFYLSEVFVNKIDWPPAEAEALTHGELKKHHDNVKNKITGMFLAYTDILKKHRREVELINETLRKTHNILYKIY